MSIKFVIKIKSVNQISINSCSQRNEPTELKAFTNICIRCGTDLRLVRKGALLKCVFDSDGAL